MYVVKNGKKFRCYERFTIDGVVHKYSVTIDRDTPQARKKAAEKLKQKAAAPITSDILFSDLVSEYLKEQDMICKASTARRNRSTLRKMEKAFGPIKAENLTAGFCRA